MNTKLPTHPIVHLITFGGGSKDYHDAAERVARQALEFPDIDSATAFTEKNLPSEFFDLCETVIRDYPRGFGLWAWKPFIIQHELKRLRDNDILIYVDSGCELNKYGLNKFRGYLSYTAQNEALIFELDQDARKPHR